MTKIDRVKPLPDNLSVEEFLAWDDGTDTIYELIDGRVVPKFGPPDAAKLELMSMSFPSRPHNTIAKNIAVEIAMAGKAADWLIEGPAAVRIPGREKVYLPDLVIAPPNSMAHNDRFVPDPVVIIEILSPTNTADEVFSKIWAYRTIPSVQELLIISARSIGAEVQRRAGDRWEIAASTDRSGFLPLGAIGIDLPMAGLYRHVRVDADQGTPAENR